MSFDGPLIAMMQARRLILCLALLACGVVRAAAEPPRFERDIYPIFATHCIHCHGGLAQKNGLDVRTLASMTKGGESGPAIDADKTLESLLWQKISADEMPKALIKLSAAEKQAIKSWLEAGIPRSPRWQDAEVPLPAAKRQPAEVAAAIDALLDKRLSEAKLRPAAIIRDEQFLRRATLDITGRLPTPQEVKDFAASTATEKRAQVVDALLAKPEYGWHWAREWHHLLMPLVDGRRVYDQAVIDWLAGCFNEGQSWQTIAGKIIAAEGSAETEPAIKVLIAIKDPDKINARFSKAFLGADMECAECHDHPYKPWRLKEDYWAMTSFFSIIRTGKKGEFATLTDQNPVSSSGKKGSALLAVRVPDYALVGAKSSVPSGFLGGTAPPVDMQPPYRGVLAQWFTSRDNQLFAGAAVNRWWAQFFGRGLVNPISDFHDGNPATHPEVLRLLAHEFAKSNYDCRHLIRCIASTKAYQRGSQTTEANDDLQDLYGRMPLRPASPDVLYTMLGQAMGFDVLPVPIPAPKPEGKRPVPVSPRELFANTFKQGEEGDRREYDHGVLQSLQLINWNEFNGGGNIVTKLLEEKLSPEAMLDELYLRTLSRQATTAEREKLLPYVASQPDAAKGWASVLWILVNGKEFLMDH